MSDTKAEDITSTHQRDQAVVVRDRLDSILNGTSLELQQLLQPHKEKREARIHRAVHHRKTQIAVVEALHTKELDRIEKEFNQEMSQLRGRMAAEIQERAKRKASNLPDIDDPDALDVVGGRADRKPKQRRTVDNDREEIARSRILPLTVMALSDRHAQEDLAAMYKNYNRTSRPVTSKPQTEAGDHRVACEGGDILVYEGKRIHKGASLSVISGSSQHRYSASLLAVSHMEVVVKKLDGSKSRILLSQLRSGRWTLVEKPHS
eukprot:c3391_g1_i1.p1 GENE.c3391_g1_i1~~c3391_g1_i1.p1  ORF type:complete len:281 (+),score=63.33 c3391_g1_i1:56-844(+)